MGGGEFVIVRAAVSVVSVNAYLLSSLPWAIGILVLAIGVSVALAYFLSSKMLTPIKAVNDSVNAQMRSEFFANAGHELKSPLTAISGFAEILQAENHDEKLQVPVDNIAKNAARMTALVDDMLKLSNLESGKAIETLPIKLELIAQEVALDLTALAEERQVSIAVSGAGTVTAGYDHIYSLLKNLIENAVKYNSQGGKVTISIEETDSGVVLSVADTGIGIAEEHQSRVFERFYRVDKGRSRKEGGTGLGLAIVKHICLVYNADLALLSRVGQGTKVTVVFRKQ
jgi:two-component system phosphate regulon sensor histidine kinase PhoR